MARVGWNRYFMDLAQAVATRATCDRKHVGAVIVKDRVILATGYNGSPRGWAHCDHAGHDMEDGHCVRTIHAEMNALVAAARRGVSVDRAVIYVTVTPCWTCFKAIVNAGITHIYVGAEYRPDPRYHNARGWVELVPPTSPNSDLVE